MEEDLILPGYTRVTEPLQGFSKYDLIDPVVLDNAKDRGTRVHKACEMHAKGLLFDMCMVDDDCKNYVECFKKWFDDNVSDVIFTERRFYDDEYKLTGCVDLVAMLKETQEVALIDIKATYSVGLSWSLQTAAYQMMLDNSSVLISKRMALNLPKTGSKVKVVEYDDYSNDLRMYLNCLELYRYLNPPKKTKEYNFSLA